MHPGTAISSGDNPRDDPTNNRDVSMRILCLHGKGGNGNQFVDSSLMPLRSLVEKRVANLDLECSVSFHWDELTAPYEIIPSGNGEDAGYSWWTMPPGVRSYNAQEYGGFEMSESMVLEKVFSPEPDTRRKADIILGHSQGAILTAALLSIHKSLWEPSNSRPLGYILNGGAWPNPYQNSLMSITQQCPETKDSLPRMLFIMGKNDNINPIESAMQVHDVFQKAEFNVSIVDHAGGHSVPRGRDDDSVRALEEVADWIVDIATEKATSC